jgi:hypothetical protein
VPLYFSVELRTSKVSLHRMRPEKCSDGTIAARWVPSGELAV